MWLACSSVLGRCHSLFPVGGFLQKRADPRSFVFKSTEAHVLGVSVAVLTGGLLCRGSAFANSLFLWRIFSSQCVETFS